MNILIKEMEMPKSCAECFVAWERCHRTVEWYKNNPQYYDIRHENCPLIEAPHGKWVLYNKGFGFTHYCSNCNFAVKEQWIGFYNFCPNCGADMRIYNAED